MLAQCLSNCVLVPIRWLPGKTTHVWGGGASVTAWMQNNLLACTCTNKHIHSWTCMHFGWEGVELCRGVVQAAAWLSLCGVVQISRRLCNNNNNNSSSNEKNIGEKSANNNGKNNKSIEKSNRTNDFVLLYVLLLVAYQVCESERRNGGKCSNGSTPDISYTTIFFILLLSPNATTCSTSPFGGDCRRPPTIPSARSGYLLASIHLWVIAIVFCFGSVGWLGWFRFGVLLHVRPYSPFHGLCQPPLLDR